MIGTCIFCGHSADDEQRHGPDGHRPAVTFDTRDLEAHDEEVRALKFELRPAASRGHRDRRVWINHEYGDAGCAITRAHTWKEHREAQRAAVELVGS